MKKKMNKRYDVIYEKEPRGQVVTDEGIPCTARTCCTRLNRLEEENKELKQKLESEHRMLDNAILLERTRMGKNSLIQYKEAIQ